MKASTKTAILVVSFGSSKAKAREKGIESIIDYLSKQYPMYRILSAYTSNFVRYFWQQQGEYVPSVSEAIMILENEGFEKIILLPLHVLRGYEFEKIIDSQVSFEKRGLQIILGEPLLGNREGIIEVAKRLVLNEQSRINQEEQLVFVGHGTTHEAHDAYQVLENELNSLGLSACVGTIEEGPDLLIERLQAKKVNIRPLLLVAGEHVEEDILGERPDSWINRFKGAGIDVSYQAMGLGELPLIQELFYQRLRALLIAQGELEDYIKDPMRIEKESFIRIEEEMIQPDLPQPRLNILKRVIHTTTDFEYEKRLKFKEGVEGLFIKGLNDGCLIITDTKMIQVGISQALLRQTPSHLHCFIQEESVAQRAKLLGITRSMAAIDVALEIPGKKLFIIGNAPTAIFRLLENYPQYEKDILGVVGVPVGFVGAAESKVALWDSQIPSIISEGRPGGSTVAVAIVNALLKHHVETKA